MQRLAHTAHALTEDDPAHGEREPLRLGRREVGRDLLLVVLMGGIRVWQLAELRLQDQVFLS